MVSLHRGRLFTYIQLFLCTPKFSFRGKFIPKIATLFAIFEAVGPHFLNQNGEIWHEGADLGLPAASQI